MKRTLQDRVGDFTTFFGDAVRRFTALQNRDTRAQTLAQIYSLHITPGSRAGGQNHRVVEVFFGSRQIDAFGGVNAWSAVTEFGASLIFERDDNGEVVVMLYPAHSDNRRPKETCIVLRRSVDPSKLLDDSFLTCLWDRFMAYMEVTCLEGAPSRSQAVTVFWLRYSRPLLINSITVPATLIHHAREVPKYVLTIGVSGFLFHFFSPDPTRGTIEELQNISGKLDTVAQRIPAMEKVQGDVKMISTIVDSLAVNSARATEALFQIEEHTRPKRAAKD